MHKSVNAVWQWKTICILDQNVCFLRFTKLNYFKMITKFIPELTNEVKKTVWNLVQVAFQCFCNTASLRFGDLFDSNLFGTLRSITGLRLYPIINFNSLVLCFSRQQPSVNTLRWMSEQPCVFRDQCQGYVDTRVFFILRARFS